MKSLVGGIVGALAFAAAAQAAPVNLLVNGSFESETVSGAFNTVGVGGTSITGWSVDKGTVDHIGTYWVSQDGSQSIDMSGNEAGTLSQGFTTTLGQLYTVSFYIAGNPDGGNQTKNMDVSILGLTDPPYSFNTMGFSDANMGWTKKSFTFTGSGFDTLVFTSMDNNAYGMALDNVSVTVGAVPLPASAPLFGAALAALGVVGLGLKRRKAASAA